MFFMIILDWTTAFPVNRLNIRNLKDWPVIPVENSRNLTVFPDNSQCSTVCPSEIDIIYCFFLIILVRNTAFPVNCLNFRNLTLLSFSGQFTPFISFSWQFPIVHIFPSKIPIFNCFFLPSQDNCFSLIILDNQRFYWKLPIVVWFSWKSPIILQSHCDTGVSIPKYGKFRC